MMMDDAANAIAGDKHLEIGAVAKHHDGKHLEIDPAVKHHDAEHLEKDPVAKHDQCTEDLLSDSSPKSEKCGDDESITEEPLFVLDLSSQAPQWSMMTTSPRFGTTPERTFCSFSPLHSTLEDLAPLTYDPMRIPSSIFGGKPSTPVEWSIASNESMFSIHNGNSNLSTDFFMFSYAGDTSMPEDRTNSLHYPFAASEAKCDEANNFPSILAPVMESAIETEASENHWEESGSIEALCQTTEEAMEHRLAGIGEISIRGELRPSSSCPDFRQSIEAVPACGNHASSPSRLSVGSGNDILIKDDTKSGSLMMVPGEEGKIHLEEQIMSPEAQTMSPEKQTMSVPKESEQPPQSQKEPEKSGPMGWFSSLFCLSCCGGQQRS